jgi:hypothetical protein
LCRCGVCGLGRRRPPEFFGCLRFLGFLRLRCLGPCHDFGFCGGGGGGCEGCCFLGCGLLLGDLLVQGRDFCGGGCGRLCMVWVWVGVLVWVWVWVWVWGDYGRCVCMGSYSVCACAI